MDNGMSDLRQFGDFRLDAEKRVLWHGGEPVNLALKQIELLCVLTENGGEVVTKAELLDKVWQDSFVEESNLSRHIYVLRKTFKDLGQDQDLIKTVPRRGYRFTGEVRTVSNGELVIEKHTRTRTRIEFQNEIASKPFFRPRLIAYATLAISVMTAGAFFGYQYLRPEKPAEIKSLIVLPFKVAGNGEGFSHAGATILFLATIQAGIIAKFLVIIIYLT